MSEGHTIEIFTAGCPICRVTVEIVKKTKCPKCTLTEYNILHNHEHMEKAREYDIKAVPSIVIDGKLAIEGKPTAQNVKKALGLT